MALQLKELPIPVVRFISYVFIHLLSKIKVTAETNKNNLFSTIFNYRKIKTGANMTLLQKVMKIP